MDAYGIFDKFPLLEHNDLESVLPPRNVPFIDDLLFQAEARAVFKPEFNSPVDYFSGKPRGEASSKLNEDEQKDVAAAIEELEKAEEFVPTQVKPTSIVPPSDRVLRSRTAPAAKAPPQQQQQQPSAPEPDNDNDDSESDEEDDDEDQASPDDKLKSMLYQKFSTLAAVDQEFRTSRLPPLYYDKRYRPDEWPLESTTITSPSMSAILEQMQRTDELDVRQYGRLFKHAIYVPDSNVLDIFASYMTAQVRIFCQQKLMRLYSRTPHGFCGKNRVMDKSPSLHKIRKQSTPSRRLSGLVPRPSSVELSHLTATRPTRN